MSDIREKMAFCVYLIGGIAAVCFVFWALSEHGATVIIAGLAALAWAVLIPFLLWKILRRLPSPKK